MTPVIAMLGALAALGLMVGIYLLAYWYYRKSHPRDDSRDR
jgi:hypothetical protein